MTHFLRLLSEEDKSQALFEACSNLRSGLQDANTTELEPSAFNAIPGKPFAYWVSDAVRNTFQALEPFESNGRTVRVGLQTSDDFRFVRAWWEPADNKEVKKWLTFAKGGSFSPYYYDQPLVINWLDDGKELKAFPPSVVRNPEFFFRAGITWPLRARRFSPQPLPSESVFSVRGYSAFPASGLEMATLSLLASSPFDYLFKTALGRFGYPEFIVGILQIMPWPIVPERTVAILSELAHRAWAITRTIDSSVETSHAFELPALLSVRSRGDDRLRLERELIEIGLKIDAISFDLYKFNVEDRTAVIGAPGSAESDAEDGNDEIDKSEEDDGADAIDQTDGLLSWAVGVAFGRFDCRLATGEREAPPEPDPFDPLPAISPGMLPDGAEPFHGHGGILVDDQGHPHHVPRLIEEVLVRVKTEAPSEVRRWLQRDFFPLHLKQYSKSRRKAPIYWPLSTTSGSYTLWLYYPSISSQTLYSAVNDFVEPKLKQVSRDTATLRDQGAARSRDDEKAFEALQALELELIELRDTLLQIAPTYHPNHDDGVQITAAPLWQLFRHKPWQKILKDTWAKLEKGDYDWAHLALAYWPDRVHEKCKTDKSLAIAHALEHLYVEADPKAPNARGRKKRGAV